MQKWESISDEIMIKPSKLSGAARAVGLEALKVKKTLAQFELLALTKLAIGYWDSKFVWIQKDFYFRRPTR